MKSRNEFLPNQQENECQLKCAIVDEKIKAWHEQSDAVKYEFELLVVIFVSNFLSSIENWHVNVS